MKIEEQNFTTERKNFVDQSVKINIKTYDSIPKTSTGQGYDYTTGCLLDYNYFEKYYNMIAIDLSKQQALDVDPKSIQQVNFNRNLDQAVGATISFIIEEAKETILVLFQETVKVL